CRLADEGRQPADVFEMVTKFDIPLGRFPRSALVVLVRGLENAHDRYPFFRRPLPAVMFKSRRFARLSRYSIDNPPGPLINRLMVDSAMPSVLEIRYLESPDASTARRIWSLSLTRFLLMPGILPLLRP